MTILNEATDATTGDYYAETIDLTAGTATLTINGELWEQRPLTADEVARYTPAPDPVAALLDRAAKATTVSGLRAVLIDTLTLLDG